MNSITNDIHEEEQNNNSSSIPAPHHENNNHNDDNKCLADTAFRLEEKKYKLHKPTRVGKKLIPALETDFSDVLDFRNLDQNSQDNKKMIKQIGEKMFRFEGLPGLVFLPNFLSEKEQKHWMSKSLNEFSGSPHPNNETTLYLSTLQNNNNDDNNNDEIDSEILRRRGYRNGLRWATLGYSYNWSKKTYHPDEKSPFPPDLAQLVKTIVHDHFANAFPPLSTQIAENYEGQTSIVNYFPVGSQMCAHQDVSEAAMEKPLVSISLGCTAVFLMGTTSRDDKPFAMFLRSGDVVVFSGETREAFHAVPRVLDDCPKYFFDDDKNSGNENDEKNNGAVVHALPGIRVNINVRQVFDEKNGPEKLPDMKHFFCMKTANALKRKAEEQQQKEKE